MIDISKKKSTRLAVFLDRDGVINKTYVREGKPYPPSSVSEFSILPKVVESIGNLRGAGFLVVVVTNQPDVRTGIQLQEVVEYMHREILERCNVDDIFVCYHIDEDNCNCRKPKPGMLLRAAARYNIDLGYSYLVGDRWRDIEAGKAVDCKTILIQNNYLERQAKDSDAIVNSLWDASNLILNSTI